MATGQPRPLLKHSADGEGKPHMRFVTFDDKTGSICRHSFCPCKSCLMCAAAGELWCGSSCNTHSLKLQGKILGCAAGCDTTILTKRTVDEHERNRMFHCVISNHNGERVVHFTAQNQRYRDIWLRELQYIDSPLVECRKRTAHQW